MHSVANRRGLTFCLFTVCAVPIATDRVSAQTPPSSSAVVMVEIQCQPGTSELWQGAFEKEEVPVIREIVQKGELYTAFTYLESPLPAQNIDFIPDF